MQEPKERLVDRIVALKAPKKGKEFAAGYQAAITDILALVTQDIDIIEGR
jgi:hypothetical protein